MRGVLVAKRRTVVDFGLVRSDQRTEGKELGRKRGERVAPEQKKKAGRGRGGGRPAGAL